MSAGLAARVPAMIVSQLPLRFVQISGNLLTLKAGIDGCFSV